MNIYKKNLLQLRNFLSNLSVDGFILPVTDEYQGEYSAAYARRVTWLCGFDGSAGMVAILPDKAALFVDGRYIIQAQNEVDLTDYEIINITQQRPEDWLKQNIKPDGLLAYDPWLHTENQIKNIKNNLIELKANPIDEIWNNQPARPNKPIFALPLAIAGEDSTSKIQKIIAKLKHNNVDAALLSKPESICWLLNIRGGDVDYNPLPLLYAIVNVKGEVSLFVAESKIPPELKANLSSYIKLINPINMLNNIDEISKNKTKVQIDSSSAPIWFKQQFIKAGAMVIDGQDPCIALKAIKNSAEIMGAKKAHLLDGVAMLKFLYWFDHLNNAHLNNAQLSNELVSELDCEQKLENFRKESAEYLMPSFATIAGSAGNGAIVHYRATPKSNRNIGIGEVLLLDSGGQYEFGTTDITRTLARGEPADEFKHNFTLVLKGHISLAKAKFPKGTCGSQLDALARSPLWQENKDYDHGTGHGVGSYLCVHEGPQRISKRGGDAELAPNMIVSNEPGYYKTGEYGIRIESLVLVVEKNNWLEFETLTLAPIDTRLADFKLLSEDEILWVTNYNKYVYEKLYPLLPAEISAWLYNQFCMGKPC